MAPNPDRFYFFAFDDSDLPGFVQQRTRIMSNPLRSCDSHDQWQDGEHGHH